MRKVGACDKEPQLRPPRPFVDSQRVPTGAVIDADIGRMDRFIYQCEFVRKDPYIRKKWRQSVYLLNPSRRIRAKVHETEANDQLLHHRCRRSQGELNIVSFLCHEAAHLNAQNRLDPDTDDLAGDGLYC